jgi:hypothetical protein
MEEAPGKVPLPSPKIRALYEEKSGFNGSFDWTHHSTRSFSRVHILVRYIIYVLIGWSLLAIPGLISFFLFTKRVVDEDSLKGLPFSLTTSGDIVLGRYIADGFTVEGLPVFIYSIYLAASWMYFWFPLYSFIIIPEIIVRVVNLVCDALEDKNTGSKIIHCMTLSLRRRYCLHQSTPYLSLVHLLFTG